MRRLDLSEWPDAYLNPHVAGGSGASVAATIARRDNGKPLPRSA